MSELTISAKDYAEIQGHPLSDYKCKDVDGRAMSSSSAIMDMGKNASYIGYEVVVATQVTREGDNQYYAFGTMMKLK